MVKQLDILALEPFFGGARRAMLETVVRCSRHRWTVLKLPPRRIERRLTAAANWFAEQLSRHWVSQLDLLFTSEAMNLASLFRLMPTLADYPSVVYFHDNQLPDPLAAEERATDLVNLNTAQAAREIWFNSEYHKATFLARAEALVDRHEELAAHSPMRELSAKARLMPPPVDFGAIHELQASGSIRRLPHTIFVETRDANLSLLNEAIQLLQRRNVAVNLITVGPIDDLSPEIARTTVAELDDRGQIKAMLGAGIVLSVKPNAAWDYQVIRALTAGCRPMLPSAAVYLEILPPALHDDGLYEPEADELADRLEHVLAPSALPHHSEDFRTTFRHLDAITACRKFDERLEQLVQERPRRRS